MKLSQLGLAGIASDADFTSGSDADSDESGSTAVAVPEELCDDYNEFVPL